MWDAALGQPVRLSALDKVFSALGNGFYLLSFASWWHFRTPFVTALIAW